MSQGTPDFKVKEETPYAEMWMGVHPNIPSQLLLPCGDEVSLAEWIEANPESLGESVRKTFGEKLPFLFKVLSVAKVLSIQAHPNKTHAEQLHKERPDIYPDSNHKPEMTIALTSFECLCGFRPLEDITKFLQNVPELAVLVEPFAQSFDSKNKRWKQGNKQALKDCFSALLSCGPKRIQNQLAALVQRLQTSVNSGDDVTYQEGELLLRLHDQFPGDVGCFCIYFLNYITLVPGQAIHFEPNVPHAYISGDCIECVGCSDNIVRAAFSHRYKDIPLLCEMLTYDAAPAAEKLLNYSVSEIDPFVKLYNPPVQDIAVAAIQIPPGISDYIITAVDSASIILIINGHGRCHCPANGNTITIKRGVVLFISANQTVKLKVESDGMVMYRALSLL